jgi:hypothetical protein
MERMGHSSPRAALIYQHATRDRDEAIAEAMGEVFTTARRKGTAKGRSDATKHGRYLRAHTHRHAAGTEAGEGVLMVKGQLDRIGADLGLWVGAGEGNRTLMTGLEDRWCRSRPDQARCTCWHLGVQCA